MLKINYLSKLGITKNKKIRRKIMSMKTTVVSSVLLFLHRKCAPKIYQLRSTFMSLLTLANYIVFYCFIAKLPGWT